MHDATKICLTTITVYAVAVAEMNATENADIAKISAIFIQYMVRMQDQAQRRGAPHDWLKSLERAYEQGLETIIWLHDAAFMWNKIALVSNDIHFLYKRVNCCCLLLNFNKMVSFLAKPVDSCF